MGGREAHRLSSGDTQLGLSPWPGLASASPAPASSLLLGRRGAILERTLCILSRPQGVTLCAPHTTPDLRDPSFGLRKEREGLFFLGGVLASVSSRAEEGGV